MPYHEVPLQGLHVLTFTLPTGSVPVLYQLFSAAKLKVDQHYAYRGRAGVGEWAVRRLLLVCVVFPALAR